jgi:hypothetical protein
MPVADHTRSARIPAAWKSIIWPGFELSVLGLLEKACELLRDDPRRSANWLERHYSWAFHRHLEQLCRQHNLPYSPRYDPPLLTDEEFAAGASPHDAPLLDLLIRWHHQEPDLYFGIEAKILVTERVGSYKPWDTVDSYVSEGMHRFVVGKYAARMPAAAMIGYILAGAPPKLVAKINQHLASTDLPCDEPLTLVESERNALHRSRHPRSGLEVICLYHLFIGL